MTETKTKAIIEPQEKQERTSLLWDTCKRTVKSPSAKVGAILFFGIILVSLFANFIAPYAPNKMDLVNKYSGPTAQHIMGCDHLGRDLFSRLLYGGRYSLALGLCGAAFGTGCGIFIGAIAGYFGGTTETVIMRLMDVWSALPGQLLSIIISTALGSGFFQTMLALSIGAIPRNVRQTRAQFLKERGREYVEAAEAINCSKMSIMFRHLLPNACAPMIVGTTMGIGGTITAAAGLSYIGLGVLPPTPEWGALLSDGRNYVRNYPHLIIFPSIFIAITILGINLLGDGLRDALDPKLRD